MRIVTVLVAVTALLALAVGPATAQAPGQPPGAPVPGAPPAAPPAVQKPISKEVQGTVKKVDPALNTVQISAGILGLFGATVEVTDETEIVVEGRKGSLGDVQEGAKVKAAYEVRQGKNVAKSIEVMRAEEKPAARPAPPAGAPEPAKPKTE